MNTWTKMAIRRAMNLIPFPVYHFLARRKVLALCYHVVSDQSLPHIRHLYSYKTAEMFEQDLVYFKKKFHLIHYEELIGAHNGKSELPTNPMILTFDDGYAECFSDVRPLLLKHKIPCIFFVTTDWVDNKRLFWRNKVSLCIERAETLDRFSWANVSSRIRSAFGQNCESRELFGQWIKSLKMDAEAKIDEVCEVLGVDTEDFLTSRQPYLTRKQLKRLVAEGFTIGAHTKSHPRLCLLDQDRAAEEIVESSRIVREWTGQRHVPFAFPFSAGDLDEDFLERLLSENKFIRFFFGSGLRRDQPFLLNRVLLDTPPSKNNNSNVPLLLHRAYKTAFRNDIRTTVGSVLGQGHGGLFSAIGQPE